MTYQIYKMTFKTSHFGQGSLETSDLTFTADRLFSALVLESLKLDCYEDFMTLANSDDFALSDAFPYFDGQPYLPKPIGFPKYDPERQIDDVVEARQQAKKLKKLSHIALSDFSTYLEGKSLDGEKFSQLELVTKNQPGQDGHLYQVGVTYYQADVSLYVIAKSSALFDRLMASLQLTGLGGKRSIGLGQFDLEIVNVPQALLEKLDETGKVNMILTTSLPVDDQLDEVMASAHYLLQKSSGFAFSQEHDSNFRKQDFYKFKAGSTVAKPFTGQIRDVRPAGFKHSVWNYAKPIFYRLED